MLNLEKFNPKKIELQSLVKKYKGLKIKGINDKVGYKEIDQARKILKKSISGLKKQGKEMRDDAVKFQKEVIVKEKELIEIIEPVKEELELEIERIDGLKIIEERKKMLSLRIQKLSLIGVIMDEDPNTIYNN